MLFSKINCTIKKIGSDKIVKKNNIGSSCPDCICNTPNSLFTEKRGISRYIDFTQIQSVIFGDKDYYRKISQKHRFDRLTKGNLS